MRSERCGGKMISNHVHIMKPFHHLHLIICCGVLFPSSWRGSLCSCNIIVHGGAWGCVVLRAGVWWWVRFCDGASWCMIVRDGARWVEVHAWCVCDGAWWCLMVRDFLHGGAWRCMVIRCSIWLCVMMHLGTLCFYTYSDVTWNGVSQI